MSIRDRRQHQGWTQEQLAQHSGLSVRTIQRLEQGTPATLESLKCLAAVFETEVSSLMQEQTMITDTPAPGPSTFQPDPAEAEAIAYVQNLKWFWFHVILAVALGLALWGVNLLVSPGITWAQYPGVALLAGVAIHGLFLVSTFGLLGAEWEQRQFRRRMHTVAERRPRT